MNNRPEALAIALSAIVIMTMIIAGAVTLVQIKKFSERGEALRNIPSSIEAKFEGDNERAY
jgi:hypothetical protein